MWGCVDVWMCGCVDVWMCGCVDVWMCGCVDVWMCGCVDQQKQCIYSLNTRQQFKQKETQKHIKRKQIMWCATPLEPPPPPLTHNA